MVDSIVENKKEDVQTQEKIKISQENAKVDVNIKNELQQNTPQKSDEGKEKEENHEDPNWRAFREARKKDRAEKEAAERRAAEKEAEVAALKAAMEAAFSKSSQPVAQSGYQEYPHEETEDERIEKKVSYLLAEREKRAQQEAMVREQQEYPQRLTQAYPDFNAMVTAENLDYLEYHYPEVARPLKRHADGFDKWSDIYHAIKKFIPNATTARKDSVKADSNMAKPRSISSTGTTQASDVPSSARLSEDRKAANWERMQRTMKGLT